MKLASHNSATSYKLVWWEFIFGWLINLTSRCQNKTIEEQLEDGIKMFNFQITYYRNDWYISHGLAIYNIKFSDILEKLKYRRVHYQLTLDKNFILGQNVEEFKKLLSTLNKNKIVYAWVEGGEFLYVNPKKFDIDEKFWKSSDSLLPLPKRYAKKHNQEAIDNCTSEYLMLDFI